MTTLKSFADLKRFCDVKALGQVQPEATWPISPSRGDAEKARVGQMTAKDVTCLADVRIAQRILTPSTRKRSVSPSVRVFS